MSLDFAASHYYRHLQCKVSMKLWVTFGFAVVVIHINIVGFVSGMKAKINK